MQFKVEKISSYPPISVENVGCFFSEKGCWVAFKVKLSNFTQAFLFYPHRHLLVFITISNTMITIYIFIVIVIIECKDEKAREGCVASFSTIKLHTTCLLEFLNFFHQYQNHKVVPFDPFVFHGGARISYYQWQHSLSVRAKHFLRPQQPPKVVNFGRCHLYVPLHHVLTQPLFGVRF